MANKSWYERNRKVEDGILYDLETGRAWEHKGYSKRIYWSDSMLRMLRDEYPVTKNEVLAGCLGVSVRTMVRKARELGIEKDRSWLSGMWDDHRRMAQMMSRAMGYPGKFEKGRHAYPDGEFKAGHRESDETKERRRRALRRYIEAHGSELRERGRKSWETRRRRMGAEG